jgi:hypothetical protein
MSGSAKKHQRHVTIAAARDALASGDVKMARITLAEAPFPPRWRFIDEEWGKALSEGAARGIRHKDSLAELIGRVETAQPEGVAKFWIDTIERAWRLPAEADEFDPFIEAIESMEVRRLAWSADAAERGAKKKKDKDFFASSDLCQLSLGRTQGSPKRWAQALERWPQLRAPLWRAAVSGLDAALSANLRWGHAPVAPERKELLAAESLELGAMAAKAMSLPERERALGDLARAIQWSDSSDTKPGVTRDMNATGWASEALAFNASAQILEDLGAKWDAKDANPFSWRQEIRKRASEASAPRAASFQESLIPEQGEYGPAFERARRQLGPEKFWPLFSLGLLCKGSCARPFGEEREQNRASAERVAALRGSIFRADSAPPEHVVVEAARRSVRASLMRDCALSPKEAFEGWDGVVDWKKAGVAALLRDAQGGAFLPLAPRGRTLAEHAFRMPPQELDRLCEALAELASRGAQIPWKSSELEERDRARLERFAAALDRCELIAAALAGRANSEAEADPAAKRSLRI